jgi:hypothetical protein
MAKNECESATQAVRNDVKKSKKSYKQIGSELRRDLPVTEAVKRLTNKLLDDSTSRLFADEAIGICLIAKEGYTYLNFIFESLKELLKQEEATEFLKAVLCAYLKKISQEEAEDIISQLCQEYGYLRPLKANTEVEKLEREKFTVIKNLKKEIESLSKRTADLENGQLTKLN